MVLSRVNLGNKNISEGQNIINCILSGKEFGFPGW
jgi:hypothetical protein